VTETEIQAEILTCLQYRGVLATRNQSGTLHVGGHWINLGASGWPDIIGCLPGGQFLGVEVKKPGEKLTSQQWEIADKIIAAGGLVIVATSAEDLQQKLRTIIQ
jgi:hypothetical protein